MIIFGSWLPKKNSLHPIILWARCTACCLVLYHLHFMWLPMPSWNAWSFWLARLSIYICIYAFIYLFIEVLNKVWYLTTMIMAFHFIHLQVMMWSWKSLIHLFIWQLQRYQSIIKFESYEDPCFTFMPLQNLGVSQRDCLVVEDSVIGLQVDLAIPY